MNASLTAQTLKKNEAVILSEWVEQQLAVTRSGRMGQTQLREQSQEFLALLTQAVQDTDGDNINSSDWNKVREMLKEISRSRAKLGFSPTETATFIFSLKQPLFSALQKDIKDSAQFANEIWGTTALLDKLGLFTMESYQKSREDIINRQQQELLELSTPVVRLWESVLAVPLIGTLDSARTQVVMENLLQQIMETGSMIAIIDITGVPTVDTLVAQHLLKTVAAARLMGADCIISGISPQTAQTIVHLGVDLSAVITKATLADAFGIAMQRVGLKVVRVAAKAG